MMLRTTPLAGSKARAQSVSQRISPVRPARVAAAAGANEPAASIAAAAQAQDQAAADASTTANHAPPKLNRRQLINTTAAAASAWVMAAGCPCCTSEAKASSDWNYEVNTKPLYRKMGPKGPANWPGTCAAGRAQSPINLPLPSTTRRWSSGSDTTRSLRYGDLVFNYGKARTAFVSNPGHGSPQINFSPGNVCYINGEPYELLQFHFHTPSEHALDGQRYAMEAHLVHKSLSTGKLAVCGVMLEPYGTENVCLQTALDLAPTPGVNVPLPQPVNPMTLLPPADENGHRPFVHYPGSLTTPPCSEKVDWFVMTQKIDVDPAQILRFVKFAGGNKTYGQNSRPLQPLNQRPLDYLL